MSKKNVSFFGFTLLFLTAAIISFTGCKKDSSSPTGPETVLGSGKITLNGGGFSNKSIDFYLSMGSHATATNSTEIVCYTAGTDSLWFAISFPGASTGTYSWSAGSTSFTTLYLYSAQKTYVSLYNGQTVITKVDGVGGKIAGTFSGYVVNTVNADSISVSGSFSATRLSDVSKK